MIDPERYDAMIDSLKYKYGSYDGSSWSKGRYESVFAAKIREMDEKIRTTIVLSDAEKTEFKKSILGEFDPFVVSYIKPVRWPEGISVPSSYEMLTIPGYSTEEESLFSSRRDYLNGLLEKLEQKRLGLGQETLRKLQKLPRVSESEVEVDTTKDKTLPPSIKRVYTEYDAENHNFNSLKEFEDEILWHVSRKISKERQEFDVMAMGRVTLSNVIHTFIGMETYLLVWVDWTDANRPLFYFKAAEGSRFIKLYGITSAEVAELFGAKPIEFVADLCDSFRKSPVNIAVAQSIKAKILKDTYKDSPIEFGGW